MKILLILLLAGPLPAQEILNIGALFRGDPTTGITQKSIEGLYVHKRASLLAEFQEKTAWYVATRAYMSKNAFLQVAIRRNDIPNAPHPWILQTGVGIDRQMGRERLTLAISESSRLKTNSYSYVASLKSEWDIGSHLAFVTSLVHSDALKNKWQIGGGFEYHLIRRK